MSTDSKIDVFFLIDISGSMTGEPIDSISNGVEDILNMLCTDHRTPGRIRLCINTYNSKIYENHKLELVENLSLNFNSLGIAEGPTNSGAAIENVLVKIKETMVEYQNKDYKYKKPLLFHITDGLPSDIKSYNEIIDKLKRQKINTIACGIGATTDLKFLKSFSDKVIYLDKNDVLSINQFSKLLSTIILYHLYSDNDDLDSLEIFNPTKPNNPISMDKIMIL
jgi:uncharacterized protein YegL